MKTKVTSLENTTYSGALLPTACFTRKRAIKTKKELEQEHLLSHITLAY